MIYSEDIMFTDEGVFDITTGQLTYPTMQLDSIDDTLDIVIPGYEILKDIGQGAMSSILIARRVNDNVNVVLKVFFFADKHKDPLALKRFMQEYHIFSNLNHPNVVRIYERAFASDFAYIAMEYFPKGDLSQRIKLGMKPKIAMDYLKQIAHGLAAIHELNIIHRDLKPANILFKGDGSLTITDFGVAKLVPEGFNGIALNQNTLIGTPHYISPEQVVSKQIDHRADLYSLGVIFYLMLTGRTPFIAYSVKELLLAHVNQAIPLLPEQLSKYQPLVDGLLAKQPNERFQSVDEVLAGITWTERD